MPAMSAQHGREDALIEPYRKYKEPFKKHDVEVMTNLNYLLHQKVQVKYYNVS
jgi:hypothetical protein